MIRVIWTNATPQQMQEDTEELIKICKKEKANWGFFGGIVYIKDREYQVLP
jgi:hypothetical protein